MVGIARRLGLDAPPVILASGAALLGQRLFAPPSVKGWEEGEAWITTASLMQRGNLAGLMLGVVKLDDVLSQADLEQAAPMLDEGSMESMSGDAMREKGADGKAGDDRPARSGKPAGKAIAKPTGKGAYAYQALRKLEASGWAPAINFSARMERGGALTDAQIVDAMLDELLAIDAPPDTRKRLREFVARERAALGVRDGKLVEAGAEAERLLRRLAHLILSLPEAQLG
jgi:hypothetical protein